MLPVIAMSEMHTENSAESANGPEGFITKGEVARRLKKTVRTIENWQSKGILPFVKAGRSVFSSGLTWNHLQQNFRVWATSPGCSNWHRNSVGLPPAWRLISRKSPARTGGRFVSSLKRR